MKVLCSFVFLSVLGLGIAQRAAAGTNQKSQADPCTNKFNVIGDVNHCDRYWECVHGVAELYDCPNGLVHVGRNRGIAEGCDYPWRAGYCNDKTLANPPISTEHCDWLYGIFGHETSCTRYWTCWNGTSTEQFCIGGLLYNEETHACDWPQNVVGCQKHPLCKEDANANVPLGQSCERYWSCQGGYPRLQRCPATLVFDRLSRRCVAPPTVDCAVPSTTPAPQEENAFRTGGGPSRLNRPRGQPSQQGQQVRVRQQVRAQQQRPREPQPEQQIFDDNREQNIESQPSLQLAPRRPASVSRPQRPFLPAGAIQIDGAIPIQFQSPSRPSRNPPIEGAIALN